MTAWLLAIVGMVGGMVLLTKSADWFIEGAVGLAHYLKMPPLIVGFVIVGFGTSAPEMLVSALAAAQGLPLLSLGNAFGSNITNILLILGVSMLIAPIRLHRLALKRDVPFLLGMIGLTILLAFTGQLGRAGGAVLLLCFALFLTCQILQARRTQEATAQEESATPMSLGRAVVVTLLGLLVLLGSSQLLVAAAKWIATRAAAMAGIAPEATQLIIGLTVVAVGTSLPELMASVVAMRKGQHDIALGNVVGSNCFNICVVAGVALVIHPVEKNALELISRDLFTMLGTTLLLWVPALGVWFWRRRTAEPIITLGKPMGLLYLLLWLSYTLFVLFFTHA